MPLREVVIGTIIARDPGKTKQCCALGLAPWVKNPDEKEPRRFESVLDSTVVADSRLCAEKSMRAPVHIRYAAPHHLTIVNSSHDASSNAPRLVAEIVKYIALADRMPRLALNPARAPCARERDTTKRTAGPGVKHNTVSVTQKSSQDSKDMKDRRQKSEDRIWKSEYRRQNTEDRI